MDSIRSASLAAWVVLPAPSPPSSEMKSKDVHQEMLSSRASFYGSGEGGRKAGGAESKDKRVLRRGPTLLG